MQDEMTRGRSQVIWRYTPNAIFRYNDNMGWCKVTDITMNKISELKGVFANVLADKLSFWNAINITGYPDPRTQPHKYVVGEPFHVRYELWPTVFICADCKRMHWWESVDKLKSTNERLRCWTCGSKDEILKQTPFAFIHKCGNLQTVFVPKCPNNNKHPVGLEDKRTFQNSFWYCQTCQIRLQRSPRDGLGIRSCSCGKPMSGVTLIDPRVYYSQTLTIVNINPDIINTWQENENFAKLLLGAAFRIPSYKPTDIQNLSRYKSSGGELTPELLAMKKMLLDTGMPEDQVDEMVKKSTEQASSDPWKKYITELSPCQEYISNFEALDCRQTVEYVFARDEPNNTNITLDSLIYQANTSGEDDAFAQLTNDKQLGSNLGLVNLAVIQELPILLGGIGYTRFYTSPIAFDGSRNNANLRPYGTDEDGKIPIFVAKNKTEALIYELDPWRLAAFLEVNQVVSIPNKAKESDHLMRAWILSISRRLHETGESHLHLLTFEQERGVEVDLPSGMIFGLLHTMSHALKATAYQYVGIDQDSLAEYLFPAHAAGLLYASSHVEFTLGGIDAVFRANLSQWLGTIRDFANNCPFDPVCSRAGGACLACLYTKFGCNYFNRSLSRAFLFGGHVKGLTNNIIGFWSHKVTDETIKLKENTANS
ncbi:MAG: DUF1998 domain-containing protein [Planctomycetes bacterium]|nr:DUF1998 domain-containing protein [Planctomycetota bacterium]